MSNALQSELEAVRVTLERLQRELRHCESLPQHRLIEAQIEKVQRQRQEILVKLRSAN